MNDHHVGERLVSRADPQLEELLDRTRGGGWDMRHYGNGLFQTTDRVEASQTAMPSTPASGPFAVETSPPAVWLGPELFYVEGPDGKDYTRLCGRHQWASWPSPTLDGTSPCPFCQCELDEGHGRERYRRLHTRVTG